MLPPSPSQVQSPKSKKAQYIKEQSSALIDRLVIGIIEIEQVDKSITTQYCQNNVSLFLSCSHYNNSVWQTTTLYLL